MILKRVSVEHVAQVVFDWEIIENGMIDLLLFNTNKQINRT